MRRMGINQCLTLCRCIPYRSSIVCLFCLCPVNQIIFYLKEETENARDSGSCDILGHLLVTTRTTALPPSYLLYCCTVVLLYAVAIVSLLLLSFWPFICLALYSVASTLRGTATDCCLCGYTQSKCRRIVCPVRLGQSTIPG